MRDVCSLIWLALIGLFRSRASLQAEILTLRHQLNVLRRKSPQRLTFTSIDRLVFAGLYRLAPGLSRGSVKTRKRLYCANVTMPAAACAFILWKPASASVLVFSPSHRALPRIFANPKESQLAEITQLLFQSGFVPRTRPRQNRGRRSFAPRHRCRAAPRRSRGMGPTVRSAGTQSAIIIGRLETRPRKIHFWGR
jgi:hypothetical protein